ncbi:MAG: GNAT family N-acetyltransferase [Candidatus Nanopelagicales bacterium]
MGITYIDRVATAEEHRLLAERVGWADAFPWEAMPGSLAGSYCGTVALTGDAQVVGMGRAVGDGAFFFYLQDIAVDPEYQALGIGGELIRRLIDQVRGLTGGEAFIGLFATDAAIPLYRRAGFDDQGPLSGMWQVLGSP